LRISASTSTSIFGPEPSGFRGAGERGGEGGGIEVMNLQTDRRVFCAPVVRGVEILGGRGKSFLDADAAAVAAAAGTLVSALGTISISPSAPSRFDWEGRGGRDPTPSHTTPPAVMPASLTRERRPIVLSPYVEKKMVRPVSSFGQSDLVQVIFRFLQIWMSHVTRMNASCHTYGVISLI